MFFYDFWRTRLSRVQSRRFKSVSSDYYGQDEMYMGQMKIWVRPGCMDLTLIPPSPKIHPYPNFTLTLIKNTAQPKMRPYPNFTLTQNTP